MPATNPRLTITLQPATAARLRRISELTGNSQSALIAEILDGSAHVFDRLIRVLEAAESMKGEVRERVGAEMEAAQRKLEKQLGLQLETFDTATGNLLADVEAVRRRVARRAAPAGGGRSTPMSNRGVRSTTKPGKSPAKTRGA
jgi:hypothetical protein